MPARAESLQITERYRSGMIRLRQQGQREASRIWKQVKPTDLDGSFNLGLMTLTVQTLQREAARLSSAYLASFIASELGEPQHPPALSVWDKTFGGKPLREGLRSAVIEAKVRIKDGMDPTEATQASKATLVSDVGLFIDTAARESLRQGMEMDDRIVGYQRAVKGTCGACSGDTQYEAFSENAPVVPLSVHPNCFPAGTEVSGPKARAATTRWYEGDLIELRTRNNLLACTPNHPILTPTGWEAAEELSSEGDHIVCGFGAKGSESGVGPDNYERPAMIEEEAVALRRSRSVTSASVPISSENFHGDGTAGGDVDVVWTAGSLKKRRQSSFVEQVSKPPFCFRCAGLVEIAGLCGLAALSEGSFTTADGFMGSLGIAAVLFGITAPIAQSHGIAHVAELDPFLDEDAIDGGAAGQSIPSRESLLRFASTVETDKLLAVRRFPFRGHVYNLQTDDGWYIANGMIVHNCECVAEPVVTPQKNWSWKDNEQRFGIETPAGVEASGIEPGTQAAAAARAYTTGAYRDLNRRLAAGESLTAEQEAIAKSLQGAMKDLPDRPTVWRGLRGIGPIGKSDADTFRLLGDWAERTFRPGSTVRLKGLQSTSFDTQPAIDAALSSKSPGIIFEIQARNGVYLGRVAEFEDEAELLLNSGRFRVRKVLKDVGIVDRDGETRRRVIVQLIQL